jgi:hypothetical protein
MRTKKRKPPRVVKAWAVVNDDTGRLMLNDIVKIRDSTATMAMNSAAIFLTKAAAEDFCAAHNERVVRVAITEI